MSVFACVFNRCNPVLKGLLHPPAPNTTFLHDIALSCRVSGIKIAFCSSTKHCGALLLRIPAGVVVISHVSTHKLNRPKDITCNVSKFSGSYSRDFFSYGMNVKLQTKDIHPT
jgi:hypothetical protein